MKIMILMITLIISTTSCSRYDFADNSGKCFERVNVSKYENDPNITMVFNKDNDYVFWGKNSKDLSGPIASAFLNNKVEVNCPANIIDTGCHTSKSLKKHGVYKDVKKYINITNCK